MGLSSLAMTIAEAIYQHSLRPCEEAAHEALGFIVFLEGRYAAASANAATPALDQPARQKALKRLDQVRIDDTRTNSPAFR